MTGVTDENAGTITIGEKTVRRLGFGAMRITGRGIWGPPADHDEAIAVLRRAVELGSPNGGRRIALDQIGQHRPGEHRSKGADLPGNLSFRIAEGAEESCIPPDQLGLDVGQVMDC